jgi:signal transduction histidine kinase
MPKTPQEMEALLHSEAPAAEKADALNFLSEYYIGTDPVRALHYAQEAIALAEFFPDQSYYLMARLNRAWVHHEQTEYALSAREAMEVIKFARQHQLLNPEYDALNILGNNHNAVGNRPDALEAYLQALKLAKTLGDPVKVATVENNIGVVYEGMKAFDKSLEYYQKALATYQASGASPVIRSTVGANVAESHNALGQHAQALPYAEAAYQIAQERQYHTGMAMAALQLGIAHHGLGQAGVAEAQFEAALQHARQAGSAYHQALILKQQANVSIGQGHLIEGIAQLEAALELAEPLGTYPVIFPLHEGLAQAYEQAGDCHRALHHLKQYQQIKERVFNEQADGREKTLHARFELDRARLEAENQQHRNRALQLQIEQNEAMIAELESYAANVAHDLKNPIGIIFGFAILLEMDLEAQLDEANREALRAIHTTAEKMQGIVDSLLSLARARKTETPAQPVDMNQVVRQALHRLEPELQARGAVIEWNATLPPALGIAEWLEEAWVNYLSNALKYGGEPPHIQINALTEPDGLIRYQVRDNGRGLKPEQMQRLFTRFERLGQERIAGTGIGLALVKTIIEKLGGRVGVESQGLPGEGAIFSFTLAPAHHRP